MLVEVVRHGQILAVFHELAIGFADGSVVGGR